MPDAALHPSGGPFSPAWTPGLSWLTGWSACLPDGLVLVGQPVGDAHTALCITGRTHTRALPVPPFSLPSLPLRASARRRQQFLAGRACAALALEQTGHPGPFGLPIGLDRRPVWPAGFTGSITHSQGLALAVTARSSEVLSLGLDLEATACTDPVPTDPTDPPAPCGPVLHHALREGAFKALYPLATRPFDGSALAVREVGVGVARLELRLDLSPDWPRGRRLTLAWVAGAGHVSALCVLPRPERRPFSALLSPAVFTLQELP